MPLMLYLDTRVKGTKINNTTGKAVVMKHKEYVTGVVTGVLAAALAAGGLNYVHQNQSVVRLLLPDHRSFRDSSSFFSKSISSISAFCTTDAASVS